MIKTTLALAPTADTCFSAQRSISPPQCPFSNVFSPASRYSAINKRQNDYFWKYSHASNGNVAFCITGTRD